MVEGGAEIVFGEVEDGLAGGALVGGGLQGIEGEGVEVRGGDLFLNKGAEDAKLVLAESHRDEMLRWGEGRVEVNHDMTQKLHSSFVAEDRIQGRTG